MSIYRPEGIDDSFTNDGAEPTLPRLGVRGTLRWVWRQLTSMRVALMLLMLLAVAAVPGSVLPQRPVDPAKVAAYLVDHPGSGAWLDRLGALVQARQLRLVSVQPSLMHAFNETPGRSESGPYWFVCLDALWATALLMSPGEPLQVKQLSTTRLDLALSLDREAFALGLDGPRPAVHAARFGFGTGASGSPFTAAAGWRHVDLHSLAAVPPAFKQRAA